MKRAEGMVEGALTLLVEARRISVEAQNPDERLDAAADKRLGIAISGAHTVLEPPSMPTDELRACGLWWDE